jgi:DNA-binding transcriptional ArsR family regulator
MRNPGQHYALSLNDLLMVLRTASSQSYQVRAEVPASLLPAFLKRGIFQAEVDVSEGQVVACLIRDQAQTVRMEGVQAFEAICALEQLIWHVVTSPPREQSAPLLTGALSAPSQPTIASASMASRAWRPAPVKRQSAQEMVMQLEDRRLRMVWLLIDGQRSVSDLAALLRLSQEVVSEALTLLEIRGLITAGPPPYERR